MSPTCSDTVSSNCAPRLSEVSGMADCDAAGGGAACGCGEALAIARSVSIICARLASSCSVSSARFAWSGVSAVALPGGEVAGGAAGVCANAGEADNARAKRIVARILCDTKASFLKTLAHRQKPETPAFARRA
jgi:hypothetical protein